MKRPSIAIAVVTHNRKKQLLKLLSVLNKQVPNRLDCIIIENESTQLTHDLFSSFSSLRITLTHQQQNSIPSARNIALNWASQRNLSWLVFVDDDCIPTSNWFQTVVAVTSAIGKSFQKKVAVIQGSHIGIPANNIFVKTTQALFDVWIRNSTKGQCLSTIDTKNCMLNILLLAKHHVLFNTEFAFASDLAFAQVVLAHHLAIYFEPNLIVKHQERKSLIDFVRHRYRTSLAFRLVKKKYPLVPTSTFRQRIVAINNITATSYEKFAMICLLFVIYGFVWIRLLIHQRHALY